MSDKGMWHFGAAGLSRRRFIQFGMAAATAGAALLNGCATAWKDRIGKPRLSAGNAAAAGADGFDYIVVGSGPGGGPLACNLALAGFRVLLLEAGGADESCEYLVPAFHPLASENRDMSWDFFVRHYADEQRQSRDEKFCREKGGVLYPRSGTLGGCSAHNAMILIYPHNSDWDHIAKVTGDSSWHSSQMHGYFKRLERCQYSERAHEDETGHGFEGWLPTTVADDKMLTGDPVLMDLARAAVRESARHIANPIKRLFLKLRTKADPNDWRFIEEHPEGLCKTPVTVENAHRTGVREYIRKVQAACPERLVVRTHALAKRILLDEQNRAYGVEILSGAHLYRAAPRSAEAVSAQTEIVRAQKEVIVSAGAFNTPQLLKLSGIGPRQELERHGIALRQDLPGVGENLQDRYEVTLVTRLKENIPLIQGMKFACPSPELGRDPQFEAWQRWQGPYTANGATLALMKRSRPELPDPDLFIFGLIGDFRGYYPGYSKDIARREDIFTWAVLKAHTNNTQGRVSLRSNDPRDVPDINFHYFDEGNDGGNDLEAVAAGVEAVRRIIRYSEDRVAEELSPGPGVKSAEEIREFVKNQAWGHHASCTCKMGPRSDPKAVVDSRFRVHGVANLRVVDASVFPKIPGFFIVSAVYMISEKASDVIIEDAKSIQVSPLASA